MEGTKHDEAGVWPKLRLHRENSQGPVTSAHGQAPADGMNQFRTGIGVPTTPRAGGRLPGEVIFLLVGEHPSICLQFCFRGSWPQTISAETGAGGPPGLWTNT